MIYCRVSSDRQANEGHGLDSQEHRCREYAERNNYEVEKVFPDTYTGGGDFLNRPAMRNLLGYVDSKPLENYVIIFDDLKRFARDTVFHWSLRTALKARNVTPKCLNYNFDDSPEGVFVETIFAAQNQLDREQNRRQVMQKMKARLESGYWTFPAVPVGYKSKKDPVHGSMPYIVYPEANVVKEALEGYASGRFMEQEDVRRFLEEKDICNGKAVSLTYVKRMLVRIFYAGYIEYQPWEVSKRKANHEPLIDLSTFERIQEKLISKATTNVKNFLNPDFPLRGFVLCYSCKRPITASWCRGRNGRWPYYRCNTKSCPERNKGIRRADIEKQFELILGQIKPSDAVLNLTKAVVADVWRKKELAGHEHKENTEREIKKIESEKLRFAQLVAKATDENVITTYEERISALAEKRLVLKDSLMSVAKHKPNIETALGIVFDFLKNPLKQWLKGNIHTKKLVLKLVFEENLVYNRNSGFETAILSLPLRVFALPEAQKSSLVEMGVSKPRPRKS
ncbi:MAG TPA: recombinase family protein [Candidatus Paceibacterota bacterium]